MACSSLTFDHSDVCHCGQHDSNPSQGVIYQLALVYYHTNYFKILPSRPNINIQPSPVPSVHPLPHSSLTIQMSAIVVSMILILHKVSYQLVLVYHHTNYFKILPSRPNINIQPCPIPTSSSHSSLTIQMSVIVVCMILTFHKVSNLFAVKVLHVIGLSPCQLDHAFESSTTIKVITMQILRPSSSL